MNKEGMSVLREKYTLMGRENTSLQGGGGDLTFVVKKK